MKSLCGTGPIQISQAWRAWSRHQVTALAGSVLTGSNQAPECVRLGTRSSKQESVAETFWHWQVFHGRKPHT